MIKLQGDLLSSNYGCVCNHVFCDFTGVYPLFRCSAADLQGAALRVHITLTAGSAHGERSAGVEAQVDSDSQGELLSEEVEAADQPSSPTASKQCTPRRHKSKSSRTAPDITSVQHAEISMDESFPVTVTVDQAMHLNLKGEPLIRSLLLFFRMILIMKQNTYNSVAGCPLAEQSEGTPCCCVSYVTADSPEPVSTAVIANADCPVWDHQHECRLSHVTNAHFNLCHPLC